MHKKTSLLFSDAELGLMYDPLIFPTKHAINGKLFILFEQLKNALKDTRIHQDFIFPEATDKDTGKITKGENYEQQPYVILDFPRLFANSPDNRSPELFAFRSMFWYGHYFSFSLLLAGKSATQSKSFLITNQHLLAGKGIYFSLHDDPWRHQIEQPQSVLIDTLSSGDITDHINEKGYFKLSSRYVETDPEKIINEGCRVYNIFLQSISK